MIERNLKLSKVFLYALFLVLPLNLGLHFVNESSYVGGLLIDYLIPTLYIQDVVAFILIILWLTQDTKLLPVKKGERGFIFWVSLILLYTLLLTVLGAPRFLPSFYLFLRWALYFCAMWYTANNFDFERDTKVLVKISCFWLVIFGLLAIGQYAKQGAVFNNYLVLGEQPYSTATPVVVRENVFGVTKIPAYGIFRHPNTFGGFLAIILVFILPHIKSKLSLIPFIFGTVGLLLTFSYVAWLAFLIGLLLTNTNIKSPTSAAFNKMHLQKNKKSAEKAHANTVGWFKNVIPKKTITPVWEKLMISIVSVVFIVGLCLPFLVKNLEIPSIDKRIELLNAGYKIFFDNLLFGVGLNSQTIVIENYLQHTNYLRFVQPTHNVFVLLAGEIGLVGLTLFLIIFGKALLVAYRNDKLVFVSLLQMVVLMSFDHYMITAQQTFLLLWLMVGMAFARAKSKPIA